MKKVLFLLLLLVPFMVKAEVKITSVELVDNTKNLEVEKNPSFKDLTINFNLKFANKDEFVKYKAILKNDTKKDYEIEDGEKFNEGKFIKYEFALENKDNKVIKAGEERTMLITITYVEEVSPELFVNGKYQEKNEMTINLSNNDQQDNPKTNIGLIVAIATIIAIASFLLLIYSRHKLYHFTIPLLLILLIPVVIYALEKITVEINANIEIEPSEQKTFIQYCLDNPGGPGYGNSNYSDTDFREQITYLSGMTWKEFFNSEYSANIPEAVKNEILAYDTIEYRTKEYDTCLKTQSYEACSNLYKPKVSLTDHIKPIPLNDKYSYYSLIKGCR